MPVTAGWARGIGVRAETKAVPGVGVTQPVPVLGQAGTDTLIFPTPVPRLLRPTTHLNI